jgi:AraC family transcriptional activator of mtrCDE
MRALDSWLKAVQADGLVLVRTRVAGPWGFAVQPRDAVVFHFVAGGRAFVRQPGAETISLRAGELVLIPRGGEHEVVHSPRGKAIQLETFLAKRAGVIDTDPEAVILICGQFIIDRHLALSGPASATTGGVAPRGNGTRIFTARAQLQRIGG